MARTVNMRVKNVLADVDRKIVRILIHIPDELPCRMHGHWSEARNLGAITHELRHELAVLAEAIVIVQQDHRVLPPDELAAECRAGAARVDRALLFHHIERDPRVVHHDAVLAWEVKSEDLAYVYESLVVSYMAREMKNT